MTEHISRERFREVQQMKLTSDNYFSKQADMEYMSVSQFKDFQSCEAGALAKIRGEYERPKSKAFLEGGYIDAHFAGSMGGFLAEHPEVLNSRTGALKSEFVRARAAIEAAENDPGFMEYLSGAPQEIITFELFDAPWKAKPDFVLPDKIVDLKYMKDVLPVWDKGEKKPFVDAYGYDIQGYVYQQAVLQKMGKKLPFYLAVITKEDPSDRWIINIPQWRLDSVAELVKHYLPIYLAIKKGEAEPVRCGACAYCRSTKKTEHVTAYEELLEM